MRLGQTITNIRKERKMTQEEFAQIFHVTRQTVSNWEKEKNYPDLDTLIAMSDEFNISLDVMLKEDKQMAKKLNREIKFSKKFKRNSMIILICIVAAVLIGAIVWGVVWSRAKDSLGAKFKEGVEMNDFHFDEKLGYYKKSIDQDSYYTLPNQSMPGYFDFVLHYYSATLDYHTLKDGGDIHIRWVRLDEEEGIEHGVSYFDEERHLEYTLPEKEEKEFCKENPDIGRIIKEGEEIYKTVYE